MLERKASAYSLLELLNVQLAYMPSCIRPEVRLPLDQNVFCAVIVVKKCIVLAQVVFSHSVLHRSKIPLVLTNKVTHLRSLLCRQQYGINSVVTRVYLAMLNLSQQSSTSTVGGL